MIQQVRSTIRWEMKNEIKKVKNGSVEDHYDCCHCPIYVVSDLSGGKTITASFL